MRKRICIWAILLLIGFGIPVMALTSSQRVYDDAALLTEDEVEELNRLCLEYGEEKQLDIVIVTTNDTQGKSAMVYADDFYDTHDFGYDKPQGTGILLLIDMDNREAYISTCGNAIDYFTDARIDTMLDAIVDELAHGNYYDAGEVFLKLTRSYMGKDPYAGPTWQERFMISLKRSPFYLAAALIIGVIYAAILAAGRGYQNTTNYMTYQDKNQFHLIQRDDFFLRETTTSRKISTESGGKGGGRTSTHTSGGGVTHGGGGRKF